MQVETLTLRYGAAATMSGACGWCTVYRAAIDTSRVGQDARPRRGDQLSRTFFGLLPPVAGHRSRTPHTPEPSRRRKWIVSAVLFTVFFAVFIALVWGFSWAGLQVVPDPDDFECLISHEPGIVDVLCPEDVT